MKLQNITGRSEVIDYGGNIVRFVGGVADVDDSVGQFILESGYVGVKEWGKIEEVEVSEDGAEKPINPEVLRLQQENFRLESIVASQNEEISKLQNEVKIWKEEVNKIQNGGEISDIDKVDTTSGFGEMEEKIRSMKKDELIAYCKELELPFEGKKEELIELLLNALKQN